VRNFIAVLKDSFREAVDGFLIWLMLILSLLCIAVIATISYKPSDAEQTFERISREFNQAFRLRGKDNVEIGTRTTIGERAFTQPMTVNFNVKDVKKTEGGSGIPGTYTYRLIVAKTDQKGGGNAWNRALTSLITTDEFRMLVASWAAEKPLEQEFIAKIPDMTIQGGTNRVKPSEQKDIPKPEAVPAGMTSAQFIATKSDTGYQAFSMPDVKPSDMKAVDTETMTAFIKQQLEFHGDIRDVEVTRVSGVAEPEYQFDITAKVKDIPRGWSFSCSAFFGAMPLGGPNTAIGQVFIIVQDLIVNTLGASVIFVVGVILTAFFIPNMLRKGAVDLLIVKPISRWQILLYKYIGGCIFVFLVISVTILGVWAVMWLRSGLMNPAFLLSIPILTFTFAVLYGMSMLVAVFTRSAIAAIVITSLFMFFMWGVGITKSFCDIARSIPNSPVATPPWLNVSADVLNATLPRYNDLMKLNSRLMQQDVLTPAALRRADSMIYPNWGVALGISLLWICGFYGLSYWRFATRDP
jgi:ABC-type transport system involved in multi-copper enzyme maturation permease subunit